MLYTLAIKISLPLTIFTMGLNASFGTEAQKSMSGSSKQTMNTSISAERVVALNSLAADIAFRLDATKLVGRPGTRLLDQEEKFKQIPTISDGQMPPDLGKIAALKPDLVVGSTGFHNSVAQKLEQQGVYTLLTHTDSWSHLESLTETLATFMNSDPKPLLQRYQDILGGKLTATSNTLVLVARDPILAPNKDSWTGDLLHRVGINSLTYEQITSSPRKGFTALSPEQIKIADPEILIVISTKSDPLLEYYKKQPFWNDLKAVKNNKVYIFDYYGLVIPGSLVAIEETVNKLKLIYNGQ